MCDYTQVNYKCGHQRYLVKAWCVVYQQTHQRCPPNVVAVETRIDEYCGDCKDKAPSTSSSQGGKKPDPDPKKGKGGGTAAAAPAPSTSQQQKTGTKKTTSGGKSS